MNQGLIRNWSPGIGDPTVAGWCTVLLYAVASLTTWRLLRGWNQPLARTTHPEQLFWRILLIGLVLLGINKQLDLQSALTETGRVVAENYGWYEGRHQFQMVFIAGIAIAGLTLFAVTLKKIWTAPRTTFFALLGSTGLMTYVFIRAASFHHVDTVLGYTISGFRVNWLLEMSALLLIIGSSILRRREPY